MIEKYTVRVSAHAKSLVVDVRDSQHLHVTYVVQPTHEGLLALWGTLQALPSREVLLDPTLHDPVGAELPDWYDAAGFVNAAYTLASIGWYSSPGGEA